MAFLKATRSFREAAEEAATAVDIYIRAASSSDKCSGSNSKDASCQKPVSENAVTIAVSVVVPVVVICAVLGYFLYRNYRKDKKEQLDEDPDFFENGEATALPDIDKEYQLENPFEADDTAKFPRPRPGSRAIYGNESHNRSNLTLPNSLGTEKRFDSFVLPYQNQTASKADLDEFARHIGVVDRASTLYMDSRNSSQTNLAGDVHSHISPTKKKPLPSPTVTSISPTKKLRDYTNLPNLSSTAITLDPAPLSHVTVHDRDAVSSNSSSSHEFDIKYEHESQSALVHDGYDTATSSRIVSDKTKTEAETTLDTTVDSPFGDSKSIGNVATSETKQDGKSVHIKKEVRISDFNMLLNDNSAVELSNLDPEEEKMLAQQEEEVKRMKSIYQVYFDRGKSMKVSSAKINEDEEENQPVVPQIVVPEDESEKKPIPAEEPDSHLKINNELKVNNDYEKRMTTASSIYTENVLFNADDAHGGQYPHQQFQYQDYNQYPAYDEYGQPIQYQYQPDPNGQYQMHNGQYTEEYIQPAELPPLQKLRNPSDFRKSTLQTYTDFEPHMKGSPMVGQKAAFDPVTQQEVWASPSVSQETFARPNESSATLATSGSGTTPSASQLARQSVVMTNPTAIPKRTKFRPAGGINVPAPAHPYGGPYQQQYHGGNEQFLDVGASDNDLIPGNRKSDIRRMMNSSF